MKNVLFITVLFIVFASLAQAAYYSDIVTQLNRLQDPTGAFKSSGRASASLQATQDSLFLYSLYGLGRKIDTTNVPAYLNSLRNSDGGYGSFVGSPSNLESTWRVVNAFAHIRASVPDAQKTVAFVKSQTDNNGIFVSTPGNSGDIISTYYAIDTLHILGESTENTAVKAFLNQHEESNKFAFDTQTENLYAIIVASAVGHVISNPDNFAKQIASLQTASGGFLEDFQTPVTSFLVTALSTQAFHVLEAQSGRTLSNVVSFDRLVSYVQTVPFDVTLAASAHKSLVFSPYFKNNFKLSSPFESTTPVKEGLILLGSQFKGTFSARSFGGVSHPGFAVTATLTLPDDSTQNLKVTWDSDSQSYVTETIPVNTLGPISVAYDVVYDIPTIGEVSFSHLAEGSVGYSLAVIADATHELTGRKINQGDSISVGTTFTFNAFVKDKNSKAVTSGDFEISFTVLDSSNIPIHSASISAVDNKGAFQFQYTLTENNLPPGHLSFYFELQNLNDKGFNTQKLQYLISTPIVSTSLSVEQEYHLGDTVEVSFVPAVFPDHRALININPSKRIFYLDVSSTSGKILNTVRGISTESAVTFSFGIEPSFDSLGTSVLSFRYVTAEGLSVLLGNYDSFAEELLEDAPTFTVSAELQIVDISEQPGSNDFFYGNDITFKYTVEDQISSQRITQGKYGYSYLAVNHFDERSGKHFTSTKVVATQEGNSLVVNWEINPNAVEGKGTLVLGAADASGNEVELVEVKSQKPIELEVTIGGEIKETKEFFDFTDFYSSKSSFVLQFGLTCHHKALQNAKLRASILRKSGGKYEEIASVPVAASGDSYSVSYTAKHRDFSSGEYKVQVFREIDQARADEAQDQRQKLIRQRQREAELNGEQFNEEEFVKTLAVETELKPILESTFSHKEVSKGGLFIRTEWLILVPLVAAFLYFDSKKRSYTKTYQK